jgi:hypothetical protein
MTRWIKLNLQPYLPPGGYTSHLENFILKKEEDGVSITLHSLENSVPSITTINDPFTQTHIIPTVENLKCSYKINWSSLLFLSEDRGITGLVSSIMFREIYFEQIIAKTLLGRISVNKAFNNRIPIVLVCTPYKGCSLADCSVLVLSHDGITHEGFEFDEEISAWGSFIKGDLFAETGIPNFIDKIEIIGPNSMNPDSTIELEIVPPYENQTVYLEHDGGYINKKKFKGSNKVLVSSQFLSSGDQITIRTGYKYWPSDNEKIITIV